MKYRIRFGAVTAALFIAAAAARANDADAPAAPAGSGARVNINQASASQLAMLPRIGEKVADRIVEYRKDHGAFARPEDLMQVKGIGEKLFLVLKPYVSVSGPTTVTEKIRSGSSRGRAGTAAKKPASSTAPVGKGR